MQEESGRWKSTPKGPQQGGLHQQEKLTVTIKVPLRNPVHFPVMIPGSKVMQPQGLRHFLDS